MACHKGSSSYIPRASGRPMVPRRAAAAFQAGEILPLKGVEIGQVRLRLRSGPRPWSH